MVRRKTRKYRGGRYVAEGTYGCVFAKSPLKCEGEATRRSDKYVSKLTTQGTAADELSRAPFLRSLDPHEDSLILPINSCKLNVDSLQATNQVDKCSRGHAYDTLLFSKHGGIYLHNLTLPHEEYIPFFNSLVSFFEIIEKIHNSDYSHCDIKAANILTQKQPDNTFKTRLIDFDLLIPNSRFVNEPALRNEFQAFYVAWPFELQLATNTALPHTDAFIAKQLNLWYSQPERYGGYALLPGYSYFGPNRTRKFNIASPEIQALKAIDYSTYSLNKVDIFSLGIVLSQVYYSLTKYKISSMLDGSTIDATVDYDYSMITLMGTNQDAVTKWHRDVTNEITAPLLNLIEAMIDINPTKRIGIREVIRKYTAILSPLRTHFTKVNLDNYFPPNHKAASNLVYQSPLPAPPPSPPSVASNTRRPFRSNLKATRRERSRSRNRLSPTNKPISSN